MQISDKLFYELQQNAIDIWKTYDDTHHYATEKIMRLYTLDNVGQNYGAIIGMFDHVNQRKLYDRVSLPARRVIDEWVGGLSRIEALAKEMGL